MRRVRGVVLCVAIVLVVLVFAATLAVLPKPIHR